MKSEFLKIAGITSEQDFYKKYPTQESFFMAFPNLKKMKLGGEVDPTEPVKTIKADVYQGNPNTTGNLPKNPEFSLWSDVYQGSGKTLTPGLPVGPELVLNNVGKERREEIDFNDRILLSGALGVSNYFNDRKQTKMLNEMIQNRNDQSQYDYNTMYGRNTSGGTEYQPIIKAEDGVLIRKENNSDFNNVEIEGGEIILLPDMRMEKAEGPKHSKGGIKTTLPEGSFVFSNKLKPEGSDKTFAEHAKKLDNNKYLDILNNKFAKKVDVETAKIMLSRNNELIKNLFNDQQNINGNATNIMKAEKGAKIGDPVKRKQTYTQAEIDTYKSIDPNFNPELFDIDIPQKKQNGIYGNEDLKSKFTKNYEWYLKDFEKNNKRAFDYTNKNDVALAQNSYNSELTKRLKSAGYNDSEINEKLMSIGFKLTENNMDSFDGKLGPFTASRIMPNIEPKQQSEIKKRSAEELLPELFETKNPNVETNRFSRDITPVKTGTYKKADMDYNQLVPNVYGLANAENIFSYNIPELTPGYIRPQTLNIQSQLNDIDTSGQSAMRTGADPLAVHLAGLQSKQGVFQSKQNFDAQSRTQADMTNANMKLQVDSNNSQMFNTIYNDLIATSRDKQTMEKQNSLQNMVKKVASHNQNQNVSKIFTENFANSYNVNGETGEFTIADVEGNEFRVIPTNTLKDKVKQGTNSKTKTKTKRQ